MLGAGLLYSSARAARAVVAALASNFFHRRARRDLPGRPSRSSASTTHAYFSDHMIQHLLLIMVAAPLFALSAPLDLAYASGPPAAAPLPRRPGHGACVTHPLVAFALYFVFIPLTHLTGLFNLMLEHEWLHNLEHVGFLVVGYLFFRAAFGARAGARPAPGAAPGLRDGRRAGGHRHADWRWRCRRTIPSPTYRAHGADRRRRASSILYNVHLGGAIMWIGGDALMLLACIPIALPWVRWETVRTSELDARLDAQGIWLEQARHDRQVLEVDLGARAQVLDDLARAQRSQLGRLHRVGAERQAVEEPRGEHVARAVLVDDVVDLVRGHLRPRRHSVATSAPARSARHDREQADLVERVEGPLEVVHLEQRQDLVLVARAARRRRGSPGPGSPGGADRRRTCPRATAPPSSRARGRSRRPCWMASLAGGRS